MSGSTDCLSKYKRHKRLPAISRNTVTRNRLIKYNSRGSSDDDGYCLKSDKQLFEEITNSIANENVKLIKYKSKKLIMKNFKDSPSNMELFMILMEEINKLNATVSKQECKMAAQQNCIENLRKRMKILENIIEKPKPHTEVKRYSANRRYLKKKGNSFLLSQKSVGDNNSNKINNNNNNGIKDINNDYSIGDINQSQRDGSCLYKVKLLKLDDSRIDSTSSDRSLPTKMNNKIPVSTSTTTLRLDAALTDTGTLTNSIATADSSKMNNNPTTIDKLLILSNKAFRRMIKCINELNKLVGYGQPQICSTATGATFKSMAPVVLTFYMNGMSHTAGSFKRYEENEVQDFIQDINDGYFPSQLQSDYPDGVPLQVDDRRNKLYLISNKNNHFSSKTKKSAFQDFQNDIQAESSKTNHYLNKFPPLFIRNGDINYIRSGTTKSFVQDDEILFKVIQDDNYCESGGICLKIRFTTGCQTYMLHVNVRDTIERVMTIIREELLKVKRKIKDFELFSTHPTRVYSELEQTLVSCGINHNMLLYARYRPETKKTQFSI